MKHPSHLTQLAAFITIVGVILVPLSRFGGIYAWPCGRIAISVCFLYLGCLSADRLKGKLSRKWLIACGIAAVICFGQKYLFEFSPYLPINDYIYWYHWTTRPLSWIAYYMSFFLLGMIVNSQALVRLKRPAGDRFWKDFINGMACFILYMVMSILPCVTEFHTTASPSLILSIRILSVIPWIGTLFYVYRCVVSEKISRLTMKLPGITFFIAGLCPGSLILTLVNCAHHWGRFSAFIALPIIAYLISVLWRLSLRLLQGMYILLPSREFGWKEIFIGQE